MRVIIPADSHHLPKYKVAALHSLVHRLLAVPMDRKEYTAELRTIEEIAEANGYTRGIVRRLIVKKRKLMLRREIYPAPAKETPLNGRLSIPYIGGATQGVQKNTAEVWL